MWQLNLSAYKVGVWLKLPTIYGLCNQKNGLTLHLKFYYLWMNIIPAFKTLQTYQPIFLKKAKINFINQGQDNEPV
jgi:hypothetical protein